MSARRRAARLAGALAALLCAACSRYTFQTLHADPAAAEEVAVDLYLVGDAGRPDPAGEPVLQALRKALAANPERSLVLFLGDNIYPAGMPEPASPERQEGERALDAQLEVLRASGVHGVFVPGNHDWQAGGPGGLAAVLRQQRYLQEKAKDVATFAPGNGCPGPVVMDVAGVVRLLLLDTQWWLQEEGPKPRDPSSDCAEDSQAEVVASVRGALREAGDRVVVVAAHHPFVSGGQHGGYFDWYSYLFPLYPWARWRGWFAPQDVGSPEYRVMRETLTAAFAENPPLLYAAGHEHNLQILNGVNVKYNLVSGGGIYGHTSSSRVLPQSVYARTASGFARLSVRHDRWARLSIMVVDAAGDATEDFSFWIAPPAAR